MDETLLNSDKKICQENIDAIKKETLVIGDNNNDLSMLKVAGVSAAVGNATQEVKDFCDYQAVRKNGEGAVAEIIEKYIF